MSTQNGQAAPSGDGQPKPPEGDTTQAGAAGDSAADTAQQSTGQATDTSGQDDDSAADTAPSSFADVMAALDEQAQRLVRAEVNRKNTENRNLRKQLRDAQQNQSSDGQPSGQDGSGGDNQSGERERQALARASERERAANQRMVNAEIRALAVDRFADPSDAPAFLGQAEDYLDPQSGDPDSDAITAALDDLLDRKPHLRKQQPTAAAAAPRPPAPNPAQGRSAPVKTDGQAGLAEAERRFGKQKTGATT